MSLDLAIYDCGKTTGEHIELFECNYTGNVVPMWREAGVYGALYNSDGEHPKEIISILREGLADMQDNRDKYEKMNPENKWGDNIGAMEFLTYLIDACSKFQDAYISIWK